MSKPNNDRAAIRQILSGIMDRGVVLRFVHDGEDKVNADTVAEAVDAVMAVDEATVYVTLPSGEHAWLWFVLGNDPEEVLCDNTWNLEDFVSPITTPWWN